MTDALKDYQPKENSLWLKVNSGEPVTMRVLTLDPLVSVDNYGNTRYSFVVWNWNLGLAQIWSTTPGNLKKLTAIHRDEDLEPLNKMDIKVTATGEMLEKRYEVMPLPKSRELTRDMVNLAASVKLEDKITENKGRLSVYMEQDEYVDFEDKTAPSAPKTGYDKAKAVAESLKTRQDVVDENVDDPLTLADLGGEEEPVDLDSIPFS